MRGLHRTIGVVLGAWLMLMGLSGALLVFHWEIDSAIARDQVLVDQPVARPDFDAMSAEVQRAYPDRVILSSERHGLSDRESLPFVLTRRLPSTSTGPDFSVVQDLERAPALEVFVDPHTHAILGERRYWTWFRLLHAFHAELFLHGVGERTVGALGLLLLTTVIAGVILWWRESKQRLGRSLRLNWSAPRPRLYRDIHTVGGIYVALLLVVQATSGALVANLFPVQDLIRQLLGSSETAAPSAAPQPAGPTPRITANAARDIALTVHPGSAVVMLVFPNPLSNFYSVRLYPTDQPRTRFTRQVLIDPATGNIVRSFDPALQSLARRFFGQWMIWMHNGQFFGLAGRVLLVATGLILTLLFPSGLYIWLRRRPARRRGRLPVSRPAAANRRG